MKCNKINSVIKTSGLSILVISLSFLFLNNSNTHKIQISSSHSNVYEGPIIVKDTFVIDDIYSSGFGFLLTINATVADKDYIDNLLFISKQAYITSISVNISSVSFQDHNLFILVESVSNLVDYNYFPLSINSDPIFVLEPSQNNFDSNNFNLTWKILDDTKYYESRLVVYLDDELYDTIYYEGNDEFVVEFSAINNGNHSILVIFYDGFGRNVSSSIEINVECKDDDLNLGLIIGLSIGGIVIIGGIIVVSIII